MKPFYFSAAIALAFSLASCQHFKTKCVDAIAVTFANSDTMPQHIYTNAPIFGYRFVVTGDFDGDGIVDTLKERYISTIDHKEAIKYSDTGDYDDLVCNAVQKDPAVFIACSNPRIKDFPIAKDGQLFGLSFLQNVGDLYGDGKDEIAYVVDWADWSSINSCHIATYTKQGWKEIASFTLHDWELPERPGVNAYYGLFGVAGVQTTTLDTLDARLEQELKDFPIVKKIKNGVIQVNAMAEEEIGDSIAPGDSYIKTIKLKRY